MASLFSRIIKREIPAYIVAEDELFIAFLDINPIAKGHTLVIPKREEDYIFDLSDRELGEIMAFAKRVAKAIRSVIACQRIGISVVGLEVPHAHVHLIPLTKSSDINFSNPKLNITPSEFLELSKKISEAFI
jgi:histidine triad (HIT) family protein